MTRKIGINWDCYGPLPTGEQIALLRENGFDATFMMADDKHLDEVVPAIRTAGIAVDNLHAPYDRINDIWRPGEAGDNTAKRLRSAVLACARHEIPALIVHLSSGKNPPRVNDLGHERFSLLMELADREGVIICYENQRMLSNLAYAFETFPSARFCWDVGHEACFAYGRRFMPLFGDKLAALHIHDNHAVYDHDEHLIPFDGVIDYDETAGRIAASGYTGTLMLELARENSTVYTDTSPADYFARAAAAARRLRAAVEIKEDALEKAYAKAHTQPDAVLSR